MSIKNRIPAFGLYGEQGQFPDVIHIEDFSARAPLHNWQIAPHRHGQMAQVFTVDDGWLEARADDAAAQLETGDFLYIPVNCVHSLTFRPGARGAVLSLPASVVGALSPPSPQVDAALAQPRWGRVGARLGAVLAMLRQTAQGNGPFRAQQVVGMAHTVLSLLASTPGARDALLPHHRSARLAGLDTLISQHRAAGWTASDYARALSVSTGHLSRLCRAATGHGAAAYIEHRIMEEACRLLAFTRLPVAEVGYRLGYIDPPYFTKRFKRVRGQTPGEYRAIFAG
ncbi:helix-turn-helix domain-containing protein [Roseicitreum antarcticum]|nr:helix-turn-helix domain-containing protein [Roseicitreum antarcticum]